MDYYLWLNNRILFFERTYKKIQDVFSDIGGISKFITFVAVFINQFYNNYVIFYDTKVLLSNSLSKEDNSDDKNKQVIKLNNIETDNHYFEVNNTCTQVRMSKDPMASDTNLNAPKNIEKENTISDNTNRNNENEKTREDANEPNNNNNKDNENSKNKVKKFNFWNYFVYKICCGKKNSKLKTYEDFRTKIISEEQLIKNHLNIYNLLKESEITEINRKHRNELNDLMKKGTILI